MLQLEPTAEAHKPCSDSNEGNEKSALLILLLILRLIALLPLHMTQSDVSCLLIYVVNV